jgi:signal transduction histidine kinase
VLGFHGFTLKEKITAASCVVLFLSSSIFVGSQIVTYKRITVSELNAVADIIANSVTAAVVFDDQRSAEEMLNALRAKPAIRSARIYLDDGRLFATYHAPPRDGEAADGPRGQASEGTPVPEVFKTTRSHELRFLDGYVDLHAPILLDGELIGIIALRSDLQQMYDIIDAYLILAAVVTLVLILVVILIAARLQNVVSKPVLDLLGTMRKVSSEQDFSVRATKFGSDELGQLAEGFNDMLGRIEAHDGSMRAAWHEAEAASRAKSEFLANMSHELRTPLNAIIGFSEVIKSEMLGPLGTDRYRLYAQDIFDSGHHLLEVINDILDISKVEAGEFELHEEPTELRGVIEHAARLVQERAESDGLALVLEIDRNLPDLLIDARLIKQSLINLLSNAIKFTPPGGRITVRAGEASDCSILLSVIDTGIGIPDTDISRILQPFVQVESAFARKHGGTGLGLPLAKSFIEAHGGSIEVRSRLGEGTAVTLQFPPQRRILEEERRIASPAE